MEQFSRSLLSSEFPVTESFWQDVFTFRSKSLSVTKLSQEFDHHPPKKLMLLKSQSCQPLWEVFLLELWPWALTLGLCLCPRWLSRGTLACSTLSWPFMTSWQCEETLAPWLWAESSKVRQLPGTEFVSLIYPNASLAHHHFSLALSSLQLPPSQRVKSVLS